MDSSSEKRLVSLDLLRGFDLFCLLMLQPILMTWLEIADNPAWAPLARQFNYASVYVYVRHYGSVCVVEI